MPRLDDLQEKRNKLMTDATALARKDGVTKEERAQVDTMLADVDVVEAEIVVEERLAKHEEQTRSHKIPPRPVPGQGDVIEEPEVIQKRTKAAFDQYIRFGAAAVQPDLRQYLRSANATQISAEYRDLGVGTPGTPAALTGRLPAGSAALSMATSSWLRRRLVRCCRRSRSSAP